MGKYVALFPAAQNGPTFHKGCAREGAGDVDQTNDLGKVTLLLKFKLLSVFFSPLSHSVIFESFRDYVECYLRLCVAHTFPAVIYTTLFFILREGMNHGGKKQTKKHAVT